MFKLVKDNGFQITFGNGLTISVMFGNYNYCANKGSEAIEGDFTCPNAEIAVISEGILLPIAHDDQVIGWCDSDKVANWIEFTKSAEDESDFREKVEAMKKASILFT